MSVVMKQRQQPGVKLECKVLEVRDIDVSNDCILLCFAALRGPNFADIDGQDDGARSGPGAMFSGTAAYP